MEKMANNFRSQASTATECSYVIKYGYDVEKQSQGPAQVLVYGIPGAELLQ